MKSSWELALERSGGALNHVSDAKKQKLAEVDSICKAKLAGLTITYSKDFRNVAGNPEKIQELEDCLATERASIISKADKDKEKIRKSE
jgi:hypothetical protein